MATVVRLLAEHSVLVTAHLPRYPSASTEKRLSQQIHMAVMAAVAAGQQRGLLSYHVLELAVARDPVRYRSLSPARSRKPDRRRRLATGDIRRAWTVRQPTRP